MTISDTVSNRKGARSPKEVPSEILELLNSGQIPTVNLSEWLAVDQKILMQRVLSDAGQTVLIPEFMETLEGLKKQTATQFTKAIGQLMSDSENLSDKAPLLSFFSTHTSDSVRCWAAYTVGLDPHLTQAEKFEHIKPFAADLHFGVREIAWMAIRESIIKDLDSAIVILKDWSANEDENIRRFASEATRPRGVWCSHIELLKSEPERALPILAPLKSDTSKYVRDSVGNWLNDASKTRPDWVVAICNEWQNASDTKATAYIIKKARRTIDKK